MGTLADLTDVTLERESLDSVSFLPTILGTGEQLQHEYLLWDWSRYNWRNQVYGDRMTALREGAWKVMRNSVEEEWQLFNIEEDAAEKYDRAFEYPERVQSMVNFIEELVTDPRPQIEPEKPEGKLFR